MITLRPHQAKNSMKLIDSILRYGVALDASETGTGKTYTACAVAKALGVPFNIIPLKSAFPIWEQACHEFEILPDWIYNLEKLRTLNPTMNLLKQINTPKNPKNRKLQWNLLPDSLLVIDEVHKCKGKDTLNAKILEAAKRNNIKLLMLSATPAATPMEMKALGYALNLHSGKGQKKFWGWAQDYGVMEMWHGGWGIPEQMIENAMSMIHEQIYPMMTRTKVADLDDFPETVICADAFKVPGNKIEKVYAAIDEVELPLTQQLRIRQQVEELKVDLFAELMLNAIDEGCSPIAFFNFSSPVSRLYDIMDKKLTKRGGCSLLQGGQDPFEREMEIQQFQENKKVALVSQIKAGGESISLHDVHHERPRVTFISPTDSATVLIQVLGRTPRIGGTKSVQTLVFAANTPEEKTCQRVRKKVHCMRTLTDGDLVQDLFTFNGE